MVCRMGSRNLMNEEALAHWGVVAPKEKPIPVATWSKAWVCGRSLAGIVDSNPAGGVDVCRECCVLSGRGLCVGLVTRPEESYRVLCVLV